MEDIAKWFARGHLDVIFCNGVLGWGLNKPDQVHSAFNGAYNVLRSGGVFVLGWNNTPQYRPITPAQVPALQRFTGLMFEPVNATQLPTNTELRHVFNFYAKGGRVMDF